MKTYTIEIHENGKKDFTRLTGWTTEQVEQLKANQAGTEFFTVIVFEETEKTHF